MSRSNDGILGEIHESKDSFLDGCFVGIYVT